MRPADLPLAQRLSTSAMLLLALALAAPLLAYRDTLMSMVAIWNRSETFTHQYLILPISLWLMWRQRSELRGLAPAPFLPALALVAVCGFGWLLGELADVQVVKHFALVCIMISSVITLLGLRIARVIAFPLAFLLFAVPAGEILIEPLIEFTADFTIGALQMTGIPVWREGTTFVIPSGRWSVVEACSGVRYLIASITLGVLYAHLSYRSRWRQAAFILLSVVVPVIANGLRAYLIVMIGHLSSMQLAVGVDHLIYGWLFFGLVMFLMFWIGGFWIDPKKATPPTPPEQAHHPVPTPALGFAGPGNARLLLCAVLTVAGIGIGPLYAGYMNRLDSAGAPVRLELHSPSWNDGIAFTYWTPAFHPGVADLNRFYRRDGMQVGVYLRYYREQRPGATLVSSVNRVLPEKGSPWTRTGNTVRSEAIAGPAGQALSVREEIIQGPTGSTLIWRWYWIDRRFVENDYLAKLLQTKSQLEMRGDDGAAVFVFTPISDGPEQARQTLRSYLNDNLAAIATALNNNGKP